jgi:putative acetyltransferase
MTGSTGEASFSASDMSDPRSVFLLAETDGMPQGCGALRKWDEKTCEIKRMYVKQARVGIGSQLLAELEARAVDLGYGRIILETRKINTGAVSFYVKNGYSLIPNYGKYIGSDLAICFAKNIRPNQSKDPAA